MRQQKQLSAKTLWGVIFWPLFLLAATPLVLAAPAHATPIHVTDDNNTIELTVGSDAELKQSPTNSYLYEATMPVTVYDKTADLRGFNLTIHADSADLVNNLDNSRRIAGTTAFKDQGSGREMLMGMNYNSWGYRLEEGHDTEFMPNGFMHPPAGSEPPSVIVDTASEYDNAGCKGKKKCEVHMTFGAAIDPTSLAAGTYSATVTYTATAKPAPKPVDWPQRTAKIDPSEVCRSGDNSSSCLVDLDKNMIPVKYTGTTTNAQWTSLANPEDKDSKGNWYDYGKKQWANAITVKKDALVKYQGKDRVVDQADILGFWVYIPRYTYEVMRRDGTDKPVKEQNFDIKFENIKTPKKRPQACKTGNGNDYRTECGVSRELPLTGGEVSTWATHPAFTFGTKELNGIWFGKFETTGTTAQPTVLPNEAHISGFYSGMDRKMGNFYSLSKTLGVNDPQNVGGGDFTTTQNNHHLTRLSSHMVNNNDWGAATYLSASKYGVGYNGVQINANGTGHNNISSGTTGCGPYANGDTGSYSANTTESYITYKNISTGSLGTQQACSSDGTRAYNGTLGQLASTTNNPTGIYDMYGGGYEYVAARRYTGDDSSTDYFSQPANPPYVNTYNFSDLDSCTFATCGGQALHETNLSNSVNGSNQWNNNISYFASYIKPWFERGGDYSSGSFAGLFSAASDDGYSYDGNAFRVALAPMAQN